MKRPLAYITAPWSADEMENTEDAARYCRKIYDAGFSPVTFLHEAYHSFLAVCSSFISRCEAF